MFGEGEDGVTLALVDAAVEKVDHVEPPLMLYCQISAIAVEFAEILKPFAVISIGNVSQSERRYYDYLKNSNSNNNTTGTD